MPGGRALLAPDLLPRPPLLQLEYTHQPVAAALKSAHAEPSHTFLQVRRLIAVNSVKKDFAALLSTMQGDKKKVAQLADLLERMMHLDPSRRLTAKECLKHPFIKEPKA